MTYEELESFIDAQNAKLAKSNRFLCANIYNAYQYMVVLVKTSMNLNQDVISAHCSFKIAETIEDCEFPSSETIDFVYMGTHNRHWRHIDCNNYSSVCLLVLQTEDWRWFFLKINLNYALETMH